MKERKQIQMEFSEARGHETNKKIIWGLCEV